MTTFFQPQLFCHFFKQCPTLSHQQHSIPIKNNADTLCMWYSTVLHGILLFQKNQQQISQGTLVSEKAASLEVRLFAKKGIILWANQLKEPVKLSVFWKYRNRIAK